MAPGKKKWVERTVSEWIFVPTNRKKDVAKKTVEILET